MIKGLAAGTLLWMVAKGRSVEDGCIQGCIQHVKAGLSILARGHVDARLDVKQVHGGPTKLSVGKLYLFRYDTSFR